jgi:serine protease Do
VGLLLVLTASGRADVEAGRSSIAATIDRVQPKIVKIHGAGGFQGLEAYQSGILISPEGHLLTVFSYVLDTDYIVATLDDGRKLPARLLGADPELDIAVLKVEASQLPYFDLAEAVEVGGGTRVLALSNLFGVATGNEAASVQQGIVSVKTRLEARRGTFETPYHGPVYVLDAVTNNPGAAGGALVDWRGNLLGLMGKELENARNRTWLNYAIPINELRPSVEAIQSGKFVAGGNDSAEKKPAQSLGLAMLGIVPVPDIFERTPPFVDQVRPDSPAQRGGVRADDLIVLVGDRLVQTLKALEGELQHVDHEDPVRLTVLRGQELLEIVLQVSRESEPQLP